MYSIRRFGVIRTATIVAIMYVIVIAIVFIPLALFVAVAGSSLYGGDYSGAGAGFAGILLIGVVAALFYGAVGWVFTALACLLYNLAAGWVGGIQFQLEAVAAPAAPAVWAPTTPDAPSGTPPAIG